MFLSRNKKNNIYPCKPQFYCIKGGLRGSKLYRHVFVMNCRYGLLMLIEIVQDVDIELSSQLALGVYTNCIFKSK